MNVQYFSKEDIENGTFSAFLMALLNFGQTSKTHYNDIHVAHEDCGAVVVEWEEVNWQHRQEEGEFVFLDEDHVMMKEVLLPDNSISYVFDGDEDQTLKDWLEAHPTWKRSEITGRYYDAGESEAE